MDIWFPGLCMLDMIGPLICAPFMSALLIGPPFMWAPCICGRPLNPGKDRMLYAGFGGKDIDRFGK